MLNILRNCNSYSFFLQLGMSLLSGLFCILVLLLTVTSIAGKYFFLIWICLIFLTFSGNYSLFPYAIAQTFGLRYYSINYGLLFTTQVSKPSLLCTLIMKLVFKQCKWTWRSFGAILVGPLSCQTKFNKSIRMTLSRQSWP